MTIKQKRRTESRPPSATALRVAVMRALHQTVDVQPVFIDPLAERILGPAPCELLDVHRANARETAHLRATLAARALFASTVVAEAVEQGIRQYIILGAGLDTFAYRHSSFGLRVFEVDLQKTQTWKRHLLRAAKIDVPPTLTYVAADLERDDVLASLAAAGLDLLLPAVFVMLGVSFYLVREAVLGLLKSVGAACARGTEFVFDYSEPLERAPETALARYQRAAERVAAGGEPWITFFTPVDIDIALHGSGFVKLQDLDAAAQNTRWFAGRTDGLEVAPLAHLVRASKGSSATRRTVG